MNNIQFTYDTPLMIWKSPENGVKVILDPGDNVTNKTTEHGAYEYTYDDLSRLTMANNPVQTDEEYTYDDVGNRLTSADTAGAWAYNQNNELGGYDTTSFIYDDNGNMIQKTVDGVVTSYVYNVEDRLTEVWDGEVGTGTLVAEYYYDPFGRRLWKEVSGARTHFHYADEGLIGEYDSAGVEIKTYGYKPNSTWTTDPLFMKVGSEYYFYHNDHLGTPQKMTGVNGAVVWSAKHSSFGKTEVDPSSTVTNNLRFPGQYEDVESGLCYNYHRYYDPNTGRYLREDPIGQAGGINVYLYALSNPLMRYDELGLQSDLRSECACQDYLESQQDMSWTDELPSCPCSIRSATDSTTWVSTDPEFAVRTYHPNATTCIRSSTSSSGAAQQCCYDERGDLITEGPGAGTPDRVSSEGFFGLLGHWVQDVTPTSYCSWQEYQSVRPPNNGNNCNSNYR